MLDLPPEIAELVDHEAEAYTKTFSTFIDLARINNRLKLHELATLLDIKPRTITDWRAGRKLPHNTKHIAVVTLLARGILRVEDDQLAINPNPTPLTPQADTSSPFNPINHIEIQKIIAAKSRPSIKDRVHEFNEAVPAATALINSLQSQLGPSLSSALRDLTETLSTMNIPTEQIALFLKTLFQTSQTPK